MILVLNMVFILALLVYFERLDSLKFSFALSVAVVVIMAGIPVVKWFSDIIQAPTLLRDPMDHTFLLQISILGLVIVSDYICHYNVHSIYNESEDPS